VDDSLAIGSSTTRTFVLPLEFLRIDTRALRA